MRKSLPVLNLVLPITLFRSLFYWIFVPLIQAQLDEFVRYWNLHRVRSQPNKHMPSGHVPAYALQHPEEFGGVDCRIAVPKEAVDQLRKFLEEDSNKTRAECFQWFTDDFGALAKEVYESIGKPVLTLDSAWQVFIQMSPMLAN